MGWLIFLKVQACNQYGCISPYHWWFTATSEEAQAAWVQAWGTIAAIGFTSAISFGLLFAELQRRRKEAQQRARVLAVKARTELRVYRRGLIQSLHVWPKSMAGVTLHTFALGSLPITHVTPSPQLVALLDEAATVGELSAGLIDVIFVAQQLKLDLELTMRRANSPLPEEQGKAHKSIKGLRRRTRRLNVQAQRTYHRLGKVFKSYDAEGRVLPPNTE